MSETSVGPEPTRRNTGACCRCGRLIHLGRCDTLCVYCYVVTRYEEGEEPTRGWFQRVLQMADVAAAIEHVAMTEDRA